MNASYGERVEQVVTRSLLRHAQSARSAEIAAELLADLTTAGFVIIATSAATVEEAA